MNDLNQVLLEGNITRDPEVRIFSDQSFVYRFTIAVNRYIKTKGASDFKKTTAFFLIEAWGQVTKNCVNQLEKGRGVRVVGKLRQATWETNGTKKERIYIVADHVELKPKHKTEQTVPEEPISSVTDEFDGNSEEVATALDKSAAEAAQEEVFPVSEEENVKDQETVSEN